jgi:hypothetical protein
MVAALALLALLIAAALAANSPAAPSSDLQRAIAVQERNSERLLERGNVVGTGVGRDGAGAAEIVVLAKRPISVAKALDGVPVELKVTGSISSLVASPAKKPESPGKGGGGGGGGETESSLSTTDVWPRPVPIGVSTGNAGACLAGTIAARVGDGSGTYALSNNHVYALENRAAIGSTVLQPGRYDTNCSSGAGNELGRLAKFVEIVFSTSAENEVDAAIASTTSEELGTATPPNGYGEPSSATLSASEALLSPAVQKYGRTTEETHGKVYAINGIVNVGYSAGTARFVNQIFVEGNRGPVIKPGDSGSLLVTNNKAANPVGLLFAGDSSGKFAVANRIDAVLGAFGVGIDGK